MNRRRIRNGLAGAVAATALFTAPAAAAQVFSEIAHPRLCDGGRVDPGRLAFAVINEARASVVATTANPGGESPDDLTTAEALYVLTQIATEVGTRANPLFGPGELSTGPEAIAARERIFDVLGAEFTPLSRAPKVAGAVTYRFVPAAGSGAVSAAELFRPGSGHVILCERTDPTGGPSSSTAPAGSSGSNGPGPTPAASPAFRVRGTVADLTTEDVELATLKPATLGLAIDEAADTETVTVKGVAGWRIDGLLPGWSATPFVSYELKDVTTGEDIDKVSPGILFGHSYQRTGFGAETRLELAYMIDREQSSEQVKARLYIDPAFRVGDNLVFGNWLTTAPLRLRPDVTLIADYSDVRDPGSSPSLVDGSYRGFGLDANLLIRWDDYPPVEGFTLRVGRRHLWLSGDIAIDDAARWYGRLEYAVKTSPVGIAITYSEGENDDTFQEEDKINLELTYRR